jgi:hypothetical protein
MLKAILIVLCTVSAALSQSVDYRLIHDARAVHDTALLHLQDFEIDGTPSWIVATITQGPKSGSATIPDAYIKAETGTIVTPKTSGLVLIKEGVWKTIASAGKAPVQDNYSWIESVQEKRILQPEDFYSPFTHGGTIVFRLSPGVAEIGQFGTVRLIFPSWARYVAPAFILMGREPALTGTRPVGPSELLLLTQLLSQDNQLVAALAFRELVASGRMTRKRAENQLGRVQGNLGAISSYIALTTRQASRQQLVKAVAQVARTTRDPAQLRFIALAAFAAGLFRVDDSEALAASKLVLSVVRSRLRELQIAVEKDEYLSAIFSKTGV